MNKNGMEAPIYISSTNVKSKLRSRIHNSIRIMSKKIINPTAISKSKYKPPQSGGLTTGLLSFIY